MTDTTFPNKVLRVPFSDESMARAKGIILRAKSEQVTAVDATGTLMDGGVVSHPGKIRRMYLVIGDTMDTAETMTVDILRTPKGSGTPASILSGVITINAAMGEGIVEVLRYLAAETFLTPGDRLTVTRDYTTGGGTDTAPGNAVIVEWG